MAHRGAPRVARASGDRAAPVEPEWWADTVVTSSSVQRRPDWGQTWEVSAVDEIQCLGSSFSPPQPQHH